MAEPRPWIALLRVAVGGVWLFLAYPQITNNSTYLSQGFGSQVRDMVAGGPWGLYRQFLENVVLTHQPIFAYLTLMANAAVGIALVLGLLTPYAALVGMFLNANYAIASGWMNRDNYALNGLMFVAQIVIIALAAGKAGGIDAIFAGQPSRRRRY
jgi:thiosulfate dehydrogenase [quinone] large subunit